MPENAWKTFTDLLDKNTIAADRKLLVIVLSFMVAMLLLVTGRADEKTLALIIAVLFILLLLAIWLFNRTQGSEAWRYRERKLSESRWWTALVALFGFALGVLTHNRRGWFRTLWGYLKNLDTAEEWVLVSLFLLGVMLGFFIVRNWSKSQQEFLNSLTAVLGAAFLATIVGALGGGGQPSGTTQQSVNPAAPPAGQTAVAAPAATTPAAGTTTTTSTTAATPPAAGATGTTAPGTTTTPGGTTAPAGAASTTTTTAPAAGTTTTSTTTTAAGGTAAPAGAPAAGQPAQPAAGTGTTNTAATTAPTGATGTPVNPLGAVRTFAFYALGFTLSGALNLIAFALLISNYSRTRSPTSRSVIDFLYGSDRTQAIDAYFLRNFEADPDYARTKLESALSVYREIIRVEFARKIDRRKEAATGPASPPDGPASPPDGGRALDFFELISIQSIDPDTFPAGSPPDPSRDYYEIVFRKLKRREGAEPGDPITPGMFRVAISMKWLENLEYVVAPGEYRQSFPYANSVAGLSLLAKRTIVMNRDKFKRFRTGTYLEGRTPNQAGQPRGLYQIDFLSYICVPMLSSLGRPEEQYLGVLHVDTKIFACPQGTFPPPDAQRVPSTDPRQEVYSVFRDVMRGERLDEFEEYASNVYEQNDPVVEDLERLRTVIVPLLELYKKCRTGVLNQTATTTTTTTTTT